MEKFLKIVFFVCCLAFAVLTMIGCVDDFEKEDQGTNNDEKESVVEVEGLILQLSTDEQYYWVSGYEGEGGNIEVPSLYDDIPVIEIGEAAFKGQTAVSSVTLPESIEVIGREAFMDCTGLSSFVIPEGVADIGEYAFAGCTGLSNMVIPDGVESVRSMTFANCTGLTSLTIGKGVKEICDRAFSGCGLTSLIIPEGVIRISFNIIENCQQLAVLEISESATDISDIAFQGCSSIVSVKMPAYAAGYVPMSSVEEVVLTGGEIIPAKAFEYASKLRSVVIPEGIEQIGASAFYKCTSLTSIELPQSLNIISGSAFYECESLEAITIPENVTIVGESAFENCTALTRINWDAISVADLSVISHTFNLAGTDGSGITFVAGDKVESIPANLFYAGYGNEPAKVISVKMGSSVKTIGENAFKNCDTLSRTEIGNNVESIGKEAFAGCEKLTSVTLPSSLTYIGQLAFNNCTGLDFVFFEDADNWQVSATSAFEEVESLEAYKLSDASDAAYLLTNTYCYYFWRKAPKI